MSKFKFATIVALVLSMTTVLAEDSPVAQEKPSFSVSESIMMTAQVKTINHETRDVTLVGPQGNEVSFTASEEARNLGQVSVGDIVTVEYVQNMSIDVIANDGMEAAAGGFTAAARTEKGEMPGGAILDTTVVTATVEEINIEANTFKLKGPEGNIKEYVARNPENLKLAEVGDLVVITYTEALAISVDHSSSE